MPSVTYSPGTTVTSTWLNEVDVAVFTTIPGLAPIQSPNLITPNLGTATAASINRVVITPVPTTATLTIPDGATATVSGVNTGDQLTFKSVAVPGQPTVVATTNTDTINYAAGIGMSLTTDATTKTVTFTNLSIGMTREVRASNTMLVAADTGKLIYSNSTFTQTFDTPANLGVGWKIRLQMGPAGNITIPSSDGVTNWIMYPNEVREFLSDGVALYSNVISPFSLVITTTSNFITPPGYSLFGGLLWGGGASGGRGPNAIGGGGGGACVPFTISNALMGASKTVTIGAGGNVVVTNTIGNAGGTSSIGTLVFAYGGGGGGSFAGATTRPGGGGGGALSVGDDGNAGGRGGAPSLPVAVALDNPGNGGSSSNAGAAGAAAYGGGAGSGSTVGATQAGGNSLYGGAGGGAVANDGTLRAPGTSTFGGNGGTASDAGNGVAGVAPAGGGGATRTGTASGAGARGECRIWGIA